MVVKNIVLKKFLVIVIHQPWTRIDSKSEVMLVASNIVRVTMF